LGLDILIDDQFGVWLMEVNANPSLNVYNDEIEPETGEVHHKVSELDKFVKTTLVKDCLKIVSKGI